MKCFADKLLKIGKKVKYIETKELRESAGVADRLVNDNIKQVYLYEFDDTWLEERVCRGLSLRQIEFKLIQSPGFFPDFAASKEFCRKQKKHFFTEFYIWQRKRTKILIESGKPAGGKWSFDHDNRKKLPKGVVPPKIPGVVEDFYHKEAKNYLAKNFVEAPGNREALLYPHTHELAETWLDDFIDERLPAFGDYEDALSSKHSFLFHSLLTPLLNIGLLTPAQVVARVLAKPGIPMNSLEGFIRQVIGWREYMRVMYSLHGSKIRSLNFFKSKRPIPKSFYEGSTGILPFDSVVKRVLETGYCHHIERLMILGNFMVLCEIDPNAVYQWFMELFVDSYDWVMVPNVYAMSQFADGGTMTTKPYVSGSNYILKMSDYQAGEWCKIWDALYWNHIAKHASFYKSNPRMSVMVAQLDRMGEKLENHKQIANHFFNILE